MTVNITQVLFINSIQSFVLVIIGPKMSFFGFAEVPYLRLIVYVSNHTHSNFRVLFE